LFHILSDHRTGCAPCCRCCRRGRVGWPGPRAALRPAHLNSCHDACCWRWRRQQWQQQRQQHQHEHDRRRRRTEVREEHHEVGRVEHALRERRLLRQHLTTTATTVSLRVRSRRTKMPRRMRRRRRRRRMSRKGGGGGRWRTSQRTAPSAAKVEPAAGSHHHSREVALGRAIVSEKRGASDSAKRQRDQALLCIWTYLGPEHIFLLKIPNVSNCQSQISPNAPRRRSIQPKPADQNGPSAVRPT
jgi:hypothetical protein